MSHAPQLDPTAVHAVKWIQFLGRWRPIILQNANGPCPLIAIANCLLLLGKFSLEKHYQYVQTDWIVYQVQQHIVRSNPLGDMKAELRANMEYLIRDVERILPLLQRGMDVNVGFDDCEHFEFTPELSVFDLTGLRLLHGWTAGPSDAAFELLKTLTFNAALDKVVAATAESSSRKVGESDGSPARPHSMTPQRKSVSLRFSPEALAALKSPEPAERASSTGTAGRRTGIALVEEGGDSGLTLETEGAPAAHDGAPEVLTSPVPMMAPVASEAGAGSAGDGVAAHTAQSSSAVNLTEQVSAVSAPTATPAPPMSEEDYAKALTVDGWMSENASQLTFQGIEQIFNRMVDREVAVFFRNNHFSTVFKHKGKLYLLITDEGYRDQPVVWERLDDVSGDNQLVTSDFLTPGLEEVTPAQTAPAPSSVSKTVPTSPSGGVELPADFDALTEEERRVLAQVLEQSAKEAQNGGPVPVVAPQATTPSATSPTGHPSSSAGPHHSVGRSSTLPSNNTSVPVSTVKNPNDRHARQAEVLRNAEYNRRLRQTQSNPTYHDEDARIAYELQQQEMRAGQLERTRAGKEKDKGCIIC